MTAGRCEAAVFFFFLTALDISEVGTHPTAVGSAPCGASALSENQGPGLGPLCRDKPTPVPRRNGGELGLIDRLNRSKLLVRSGSKVSRYSTRLATGASLCVTGQS